MAVYDGQREMPTSEHERLRWYAQHKPECARWVRSTPDGEIVFSQPRLDTAGERRCTCGLDAILAAVQETQIAAHERLLEVLERIEHGETPDAPFWYSPEETVAWQAGWNKGQAAVVDVIRAAYAKQEQEQENNDALSATEVAASIRGAGKSRPEGRMRSFRVGVFTEQREGRKPLVLAYTTWFDPSWRGCCLHTVEAVNGTAAKKLAIADHLVRCMAASPGRGE